MFKLVLRTRRGNKVLNSQGLRLVIRNTICRPSSSQAASLYTSLTYCCRSCSVRSLYGMSHIPRSNILPLVRNSPYFSTLPQLINCGPIPEVV